MSIRKATISFLFLSLILIGGSHAQNLPPALQPLVQELDKTATEMVKDPNAASFSIGIATKDGLVWSKAYGFANIENKVPATPDSIYRIGSITKQFTAVMLLQLVHDGKVHLSDPVEKYFPEINLVTGRFPGAPPITLMQLATHTAGLSREPEDMDTYVKGPVSQWEKTLIAALPHVKYALEPGTHFSYSNIGYAILGATLSRAAKQPFTDYVREKILLPLGMTHSDFEATPAIRKTLATGYVYNDDKKPDSTDAETELKTGRGYKVPNGALFSTVGDLARFEQFEMRNGPETVLPHKDLAENFQRMVASGADLTSGYGIGFTVDTVATPDSKAIFIGHDGGVAGYVSSAHFESQSNVGIVILHNALDPNIGKLMEIYRHKLDVKSLVGAGKKP